MLEIQRVTGAHRGEEFRHADLPLRGFDMPGLLSIVILLCLLGLFAQGGLKAMETRLLPWHVHG